MRNPTYNPGQGMPPFAPQGQGGFFNMGNAMQGLGQGLGNNFGGIFSSLFGHNTQAPWTNPAMGAFPFMGMIPGQVSPYFAPYMMGGQTGMNALQQALSQYGGMASNPAEMMNKIGAGYQQSPGYEFARKQMEQAAQNQAAAGGYMGSPAAQQETAQMIKGLANQDYNNYLQNALGLQSQGLSGLGGIGQGLAGMGYGAAGQMGGMIGNNLQNMAMLNYMAQMAQNRQAGGQAAAGDQRYNSLLSSLGGLFGGFMGGGLGGIGNLFGSLFGGGRR